VPVPCADCRLSGRSIEAGENLAGLTQGHD